ncbi:inositol monophosphatase 1-like [Cylas formicarius]|uniref:inositol monophosphatase 1-like n=1 Tax=Cylas formicarius TaxID=197179 RepID=UPI0029587205|nr:inositol monophosphatase 1-like [Cylas formicarius]
MEEQRIQRYYEFILPLILEAGKVLLKANDVDVETKNDEVWDLVTVYDRKIEEVLIKKIKQNFPEHKYIGEEESDSSGEMRKLSDDPTWFIDPIDGTANFVRGLPISCISVGLTVNKDMVMGIVYNPFMDELYTAFKGQGAYMNGHRIRTSGCKDIRRSVFNYEITIARRNEYYFQMYMYRTKHLIREITGIRSMGCGVLGLCYVANGRTDAYQADGLFPWDAAAGVLIVREAGGHVVDTFGKEFDLMDPNFLATATKELSDQYMEVERRADNELLNNSKQNKPFTI